MARICCDLALPWRCARKLTSNLAFMKSRRGVPRCAGAGGPELDQYETTAMSASTHNTKPKMQTNWTSDLNDMRTNWT